ncbi:MAG: hypothetical protein JWR38_5248 [Mucilaginibacter sp.]|nr:hypothetical protein [Mucilaginibacter sp.]
MNTLNKHPRKKETNSVYAYILGKGKPMPTETEPTTLTTVSTTHVLNK